MSGQRGSLKETLWQMQILGDGEEGGEGRRGGGGGGVEVDKHLISPYSYAT